MTSNEIGRLMIETAIAVHSELGPGLLETVYEVIPARELGDHSPPEAGADLPAADRLQARLPVEQADCDCEKKYDNNRLLPAAK